MKFNLEKLKAVELFMPKYVYINKKLYLYLLHLILIWILFYFILIYFILFFLLIYFTIV